MARTLFQVVNLHILTQPPINLELKVGECLAVTGDSGSGKSLFLRALADLDPHQGDILLNNKSADSYPPWQWRRQVGYLPAESGWWLPKVIDHFADQPTSLYQHLAELGLRAEVLDTPVHLLSSGERQRLALLRLLQNRPKVLLLDEPTANLDSNNSRLVEKFLRRYLTHQDSCFIWITHDQAQARRVASKYLRFIRSSANNIQAA